MRRRYRLDLPLGLRFVLAMLVLLSAAGAVHADSPFDLAGPKVDVHVQRDGKTLPIAEVPNLLPGDRLWIHPDLPESQSAHYILVVAFLRGATNPPPPEWFKRVETWDRQVRQEGVFVVVPPEAQQALLFLAPETSGDFSTLRAAVRGRPGAFVRATQDLQQASWDRLRLDAYLTAVSNLPPGDPAILKERTELAAHSLDIRVDQQCFDKPTEQQAPCLIQHTDGLVLDDSNAQSMVTQMASGSSADMMNQLSYSALGGAGQFSPYVGAIVDLARIMSTMHTAKYQYIPALALPQKEQADTLNLRLDVPPSFRNPKSVIVVALPPIGPGRPPHLHSSEPFQSPAPKESGSKEAGSKEGSAPQAVLPAYCATKPDLALLVQGAPLVFATSMAYDLTLHVDTKTTMPAGDAGRTELAHPDLAHPELANSELTHPDPASPVPPTPAGASNPDKPAAAAAPQGLDLPVRADPSSGGFVLLKPMPALPESEVVAELRGKWGFDSWQGPKFRLRAPHPGGWAIAASDQNALIIGREDALHIQGSSTLCVSEVQAAIPEASGGDQTAQAKPVSLAWKSPRPELLEVGVPLRNAAPGTVTLSIRQYGLDQAEELQLEAYGEAAALDHLMLSTGDRVAVLKGKRLDEVKSADLAGIAFSPAALNRVQDFDQLEMTARGATTMLQPGSSYSARVMLRDGRTLHVPVTVASARPQVVLLSKSVQPLQNVQLQNGQPGPAGQMAQNGESDPDPNAPQAGVQQVHLGSPDDLPLQRRLVFFLRTKVPASFPRSEKIEIAAVDNSDGSFQTTLSFADGSLVLEDAHTAVAAIDPMARFGPSAFGPIQLRAVTADGTTGDWVPLGSLVRLPGFTGANALRCPHNPSRPCLLTGSNLFLITAVGATQDMANAVDVPSEFSGSVLNVPNVGRAAGIGNAATLYLRLRDDPETVQALSLPVSPMNPPTAPANPAGAPGNADPGAGPGGSPAAKTETGPQALGQGSAGPRLKN